MPVSVGLRLGGKRGGEREFCSAPLGICRKIRFEYRTDTATESHRVAPLPVVV